MGISFANPLLAWGALLAALPILVHLLQRRRPKPHPFAAMELVIRSQRQNVRRLRLKRLLLLAARTAILLFLPLALAKPHFAKDAAASASPKGPAATAIVLDASLSMQWKDGKRNLLENAREDARRVLSDLLSEEPVTVVRCDGGRLDVAPPSFDRGQARRVIDETEATFLAADLGACLGAAAQALGESPLAGKRIYVATDLTASGWQQEAPPPTVPTEAGEVRPDVVILDAARGNDLPNLAITELRVEPAPEIGPRGRAFTFTVRNFGKEAVTDHPTELRIGGEVVTKGFVDVPGGGSVAKRLLHRFPSGGAFSGEVRIEADALEADDGRAFVVEVPRDIRALVVDGDPSSVRYRDEAFFVETALRAGGSSPVSMTVVDADSFPEEELGAWDLVLLLNVRAPEPQVAGRLRAFVEGGGGLFLALGDQVEPDAYNERFGTLLPLPLHLLKTAAEPGEEEGRAARFADLNLDHPMLRIFAGAGSEGFSATRTSRYFLLQPGAGATTLASFDDGAPALVERGLGDGRVILFTSTADRDWSDWAIQSSFLPTIQQMAGYLSRSLDERRVMAVQVGEGHSLDLPEGTKAVAVITPDRRERPIGEGVRIEVDRPGVHIVRTNGVQGEAEEAFAAYLGQEESDTRRLDPGELRALLGGATTEVEQVPAAKKKGETPLWSLLLAVGVLAFFLEGTLIRR